jgi:hypothetical protein
MLAAVEKAKVDPQRRYYGAHIVGHGYTEVPLPYCAVSKPA